MLKKCLTLSGMMLLSGCSGEAASTLAAPGVPNAARSATAPDPTGTFYITNDVTNNLRGDGLAAYLESGASSFAGSSRYKDGECGVGSTLFASPSGSGDAVMNSASTQDRRCASFPRKVTITYSRIGTNGATTPEGHSFGYFGGVTWGPEVVAFVKSPPRR